MNSRKSKHDTPMMRRYPISCLIKRIGELQVHDRTSQRPELYSRAILNGPNFTVEKSQWAELCSWRSGRYERNEPIVLHMITFIVVIQCGVSELNGYYGVA